MRFAHISDLHLHARRPPARALVGKRLLGGVNLIFNRGHCHKNDALDRLRDDAERLGVDHVLCTGDLTNLSLDEELEFAHRRLGALVPNERLTLVPGNHDCYVPSAAGRFEQRFGVGPFPTVTYLPDATVIGVNTAHASAPGLAVGTVGTTQLDALGRVLAAEAGAFRIVLIHHHVADEHGKRSNRLRDAGAVRDVIAEHGAELILHGHLHRDVRYAVPGPRGPVPVIGAGSATLVGARDPARRARYNVYDVAQGRLAEVQTRVYDGVRDAFGPAS
jgi:3',5'-cyclic AMP phosphodiesterase CpdA